MKKKILSAGIIVLLLVFSLWLYRSYSVPIIAYHTFSESRKHNTPFVALDKFYEQMSFIKYRGYRVISLADYCRLLRRKAAIPHNLVVITFDDGYADNMDAFKVLRKFDFPATVFVIVDKLDKEGYLSRRDIAWLIQNTRVRVGSHTSSHAYLPSASDEDLIEEVTFSKKHLQDFLGIPVETIAYPVGGFDARTLRIASKTGYVCGCTTNRGFTREGTIFSLRRIKITDRDGPLSLWLKLSGFYTLFKRPKHPS